jgi:hypothetical protein
MAHGKVVDTSTTTTGSSVRWRTGHAVIQGHPHKHGGYMNPRNNKAQSCELG